MVTISFTQEQINKLYDLVDLQYGYELEDAEKILLDKIKEKLEKNVNFELYKEN